MAEEPPKLGGEAEAARASDASRSDGGRKEKIRLREIDLILTLYFI